MEVKQVPLELENMVLQYIIKALRDEPTDVISHAAEYFSRLNEESKPKKVQIAEGSKEHIASVLGTRRTRRGTVMGERYNPELDDDDEALEIVPKTDEERERIRSKCGDLLLFRVLDETDVNAVIDAMKPKHVEEGQVVIKQGDDGDFFYLIDRGKFTAEIKDQEGNVQLVSKYDGEGFFGELALLHNQPRAATVRAATKGLLWALSRKTFNRLIVRRAFEKRQLYMKLLDGVPQLKPLTEYDKMQVADALSGKAYSAGEVIVKEGDEGDGMYFIVEGKVSCTKKTDGGVQDVEIAELGEGEYFGELALVKHQPRAATVIAVEDTKVAFLDVKAFERLLGPCMDFMKRHTEKYEKRVTFE